MEFNEKSCFFSQLELVLSKLISPKFHISDDTVFQKLFDAIFNAFSTKDDHDRMIQLFIPWITSVINEWSVLHSNSQVFALKIVSLICKSENGFILFNKDDCISKILAIYRNDKINFSLTLAFINIVHACNGHFSGLEWIIASDVWNDVLQISLGNASVYAIRKSRGLIAEILFSSADKNVSFCQELLCRVYELCLHCTTDSLPKNDFYSVKPVSNTLHCLNNVMLFREIFVYALNENISLEGLFDIGLVKLKDWAWENIATNEDFLVISNFSKLICALNIASTPHSAENVNYSDVVNIKQTIIEHCIILLKKNELELIQEVCTEYLMLWNQFGIDVINDQEGTNLQPFQSIPCSILVLPVYILLKDSTITGISSLFISLDGEETYSEEFRYFNQFYLNEFLRRQSENNHLKLLISAINYSIKIAKFCEKEQLEIISQMLVGILKKIIPNDYIDFECQLYNYNPNKQIFSEYLPVLSSTLEAIYYLSSYEIWRETKKSLEIVKLVQAVVNISCLPTKLYIDALKVLKVILRSYLSKHCLTFAWEEIHIKTHHLNKLGHQIHNLLHSIHWEVRDSALELLQTICELAYHKILAFLPQILDNSLPELLLSIVQSDSEPYVKASALICLSIMVRIETVFKTTLQVTTLLNIIENILIHNPEGIVRYKCVSLAKELFNHERLSEEDTSKMLDLLCHISIRDLHWEVKNAALNFWDSILDKALADEGVIDGNSSDHISFPLKRNLAPIELSSRIRNVFNKLDDYGCLNVLWEIIQHDCDLEVTKAAGKLILKMIELMENIDDIQLKKAKLELTCSKNNCLNKGLVEIYNEGIKIGVNQKLTTEEVIESIVSEGDLQLLAGLLKEEVSSQSSISPSKSRLKLGVQEFLTNLKLFNVKKSEKQKIEWLTETSDGVMSLFDDILLSNRSHHNKINAVDCY